MILNMGFLEERACMNIFSKVSGKLNLQDKTAFWGKVASEKLSNFVIIFHYDF